MTFFYWVFLYGLAAFVFGVLVGRASKASGVSEPVSLSQQGCGKDLAAGQYWNFCGETDMGQTLPALCIECGGKYELLEKRDNHE